MSGLGYLWRRITGADQPLEHCEIHVTFQPECPTCVRLNEVRRQSWQVETYSPVEPLVLFDANQSVTQVDSTYDASSGADSSSTGADTPSSGADTSSGFDGFDGGSSGGGGASGDW